jgi:hypothetical protein
VVAIATAPSAMAEPAPASATAPGSAIVDTAWHGGGGHGGDWHGGGWNGGWHGGDWRGDGWRGGPCGVLPFFRPC